MTHRPLIVITNRCFPETRALLEKSAIVNVNDLINPWTNQDILARCRDASALMAFMTDSVDAELLAACPNLKIVAAALKGYDNIDVDAATKAGVWVTIVPDLLTVPTAELAIGLLLAIGRKILVGDHRIRQHGFKGWRPDLYGTGLASQTVGLIGFGRVGQAIARRLVGFECSILAYDVATTPPPPDLDGQVNRASLQDMLAAADYVVLALPLLKDTLHLIDASAISRMKRGAYLINPARGSLVDEAAVADAIASGQLSGYAADAFECEDWARAGRPAGIDPRLTEPSAATVLTPHIGSAVTRVRREIELSAANSILDVLEGRTPRHAINNPKQRLANA